MKAIVAVGRQITMHSLGKFDCLLLTEFTERGHSVTHCCSNLKSIRQNPADSKCLFINTL